MRFACEFYNMFFNIGEYDELIVYLSPSHDIDKIEDFFKKHPEQTITIYIDDSKHFNQYHWLSKLITLVPTDKYNWQLKLKNPWDENTQEIVQDCNNMGIPFFYDIFVDSWEVLYNIVKYKPAEVYITNSLAFDIQEVSKVLHENNIKVRVYPNIAQSSVPDDNDITSFFIRPEDARHYVDYVDTMEIFAPIDQDILKAFYYLMYSNCIKWMGPLNQFIIGLDEQPCLNNAIIDTFGPVRLKCKRECTHFKNCRMCHLAAEFGQLLTEHQLGLQYKSEYPQKIDRQGKGLSKQLKENIKQVVLQNLKIDDMDKELKDVILEKFKNF